MVDYNKEVKAIVLAAGKGTRMKSNKPKVLHEIFSKPLLGWVLRALCDINPIVVGGHHFEEVKDYLKNYPNCSLVEQKEQLGTGHAVKMCVNDLKDFKGAVLILCGDTPLITKETIEKFINYHFENNSDLTVMSAIFDNPFGYGRIVRNKNNGVDKIVEQKDATDVEKEIKEVNAGIYCLNWEKMQTAFDELKNDNAQKEYYLTDIISWANSKGFKTQVYTLEDNNEIFGINSREQLAIATSIMNERHLKHLMQEGVTIVDPKCTHISPETTIGCDTIIYPSTYINGKNEIGENCKIGPMSHLRGNCKIENFVKIGNFVELKNAIVKSHTNVCHLSYVGDTEIGEHVNVGAGTITANYNSITKEKNKTIIKDGASIGSNTVLVAPVTLNENAFIGALSVITKDVECDSLAITRNEQKEYKGWVNKKKGITKWKQILNLKEN